MNPSRVASLPRARAQAGSGSSAFEKKVSSPVPRSVAPRVKASKVRAPVHCSGATATQACAHKAKGAAALKSRAFETPATTAEVAGLLGISGNRVSSLVESRGVFTRVFLTGERVEVRTFKGECVSRSKGWFVPTLFDRSGVERLKLAAERERESVALIGDVERVLGLGRGGVVAKIRNGTLTHRLLEGEEFSLRVSKASGVHDPLVFDKRELERLEAALEEEHARLVLVFEMPEALKRRRVRINYHALFEFVRRAEKIDEETRALGFEIAGKKKRVVFKRSKHRVKARRPAWFMSRGDFNLFALHLKERQASRSLPEGFVWLADANRQLGLRQSTLKIRAIKGKIRAKKIGGRHAISERQFKKLQREFASKTPSEKSVALREVLGLSKLSLYGATRTPSKSRIGIIHLSLSRGRKTAIPTLRMRKQLWMRRVDLLAYLKARYGSKTLELDAQLGRMVLYRPGKAHVFGEDYGIGIPKAREEEFSAKELNLASFYRQVFHAPQRYAIRAILEFLRDFEERKPERVGDFDLAKLWLARTYRTSNHQPLVFRDIDRAFELPHVALAFTAEHPNGSHLFFKQNGNRSMHAI